MRDANWIKRLRGLFGRRPSTSTTAPPADSGAAGVTAGPQSEGYSSDQPIRSKEHDRFNRWPFAERVAATLAARADPSSLVIGIYGAWGDGKSSTLFLMEQALDRHPHVVRVRFNPWHFDSEEQLLRGFFATLADALGRSLPTRVEELGRLLTKYGSLLSLASVSVAGGAVQVSAGEAAKGFGEALSTVALDDLRTRLEHILRESGKRVVVLIDDLDRLDRREIQTIFRLIKLSASFEYTSYVVAFDDEMVAAALGDRYGPGGATAGRAFLEKIVQVPLHLPPAEQAALRRVLLEGVDSALQLSGITITKEQAQAFVRHFVDGLEAQLRTPRQAKLYANVLQFALPLLKGEVHPVDQMLIEGIRVFYPRLYLAIRDNPEMFLKGAREGLQDATLRPRATDIIEGALKDAGVPDREQVRTRLLEVLFPRLKSIFGNTHYGSDWDEVWLREQRVCSPEYFQRYFRYGIPPGDVPDVQVELLLELAAAGNTKALNQLLANIGEIGGMPRLIPKLRVREDHVEPATAGTLALAIARNGTVLPREEGMLINDWTFSQAGILVMKLLKREADADGRANLARQVVTDAEPLVFSFECVRWLRKSEDEPEGERLLPVAVEEELRGILAQRIRVKAQEGPIFRTFGSDAPRLLWAWGTHAAAGEVDAYLRAALEADPVAVDALLDTYVGTAWGMESGLSHRADFGRDAYDALTKLVDPEFVLAKLRARHGAELDTPQFRHPRETPLSRRIAHQFAYIHRAVRKAQAATHGTEPKPVDSEQGDPDT